MNFERLRYLAAVARTGSVRGAAAALHVTPGAVSKGLARLEQESGTQLLVPAGRGVALTDDGLWLARRAEHLVGEYTALGSDLATRRGREPELCMATYDVFAAWFPGQVASRYLPGVPLSVRERWPGEVEVAVANGESDVGVTYIPVATEGVDHVEAARVQLAVYTVRGAFVSTPVDMLPFAVPSHPVSGAMGQYGPLDGWPADAPLRDVRFRASSLEARLELARQGVAAVLLPTFVADMHDRRVLAVSRLELRPLPRAFGRLSRRVHVATRTGTEGALRGRCSAIIAGVRAMCG